MKWLIGGILIVLIAIFWTAWKTDRRTKRDGFSFPVLEGNSNSNAEFIASDLKEFWDSFQSKVEELWMKGEKTATTLIPNAGDVINAMDWLSSREQFVNTPGTMITAENFEITNPGEDCLPNQTLLYVNGYRFRLFGVVLNINSKRISLRFPNIDKIDWNVSKEELKILAHETNGKKRWARVQHIGSSLPVQDLTILRENDGVVIKLN